MPKRWLVCVDGKSAETMADVLGKDLEVYNKEKEAFLRDLKHFHETRG